MQHIISRFCGCSLSDKCIRQLKIKWLRKRLGELEFHGNMYFTVEKMCSCSRQCGGIFCDPIALNTLCGVPDREEIIQEILTGL